MGKGVETQSGKQNPNRVLTNEEITDYHRRGFIGPFTVLSPEEAAEYRERIDENVLVDGSAPEGVPKPFYRHRDSRTVYDLCTHPEIVNRMADIYGPDLLLWSSKLWRKPPGMAEVPWHQHHHHLPLEPQVCVTAWLALTEATVENGCMQLIPGTQNDIIEEVEAPEDNPFTTMANPEKFDESEAVTMEVKPGQCFLFAERTLHRSFQNTTDSRRLSLVSRVTVPFVRFDRFNFPGDPVDPEYLGVMVTNGKDWQGINKTVEPPSN